MPRACVTALVLMLAAPQGRFDPRQHSLAASAVQSIYSADPQDPWNQAFFLLFTRTVSARLIADGSPVFAAGDERLRLSDRRITRIESGDRAIDPLYPSWVWMGSASFDFRPGAPWQILAEPRRGELLAALEGIRRTADARPLAARALMQADLWSVYDVMFALSQARPIGATRDAVPRARELLAPLATTIRSLALSREEIARLPDNYASAVRTAHLPDLFSPRSPWMEIRWYENRSHDDAAGYRRASRVFIRPSRRPGDEQLFLDRFREGQGDSFGALDSVALLTEPLLIAADGTIVPSPMVFDVQLRGAAARIGKGDVVELELSRRALLASPGRGGLVAFTPASPAYMPIAGNDLSFASPPRLEGEPVVAPLATRCAACHGTGHGVGHLMTFSQHTFGAVPNVARLDPRANVHAESVAARKKKREDFKALLSLWQ